MSVKVTTDGKRILADIPWMNGRGKDLAKAVPGRRPVWDKSVTPNKFLYWTYPLTMDTCRTLRRVFGAQLEIQPALATWARAALAREAELESIRTGEATGLALLRDRAPELALAMDARSYQLSGTSFFRAAGAALLGDQPGLGKTLQTLGALVDSGAHNILVACPRTATKSVWQRETWRWAPTIRPIVAQGTRAQRESAIIAFQMDEANSQRMLIINTEMVRVRKHWICPDGTGWYKAPGLKGGCYGMHDHKVEIDHEWPWLFQQGWDAIVMDESHNVLASTKNIQSKSITQGRHGAMLLRRKLNQGGLAIALSGTPFRSNLVRAWGTLNWLRPDVFSSFWQFAETHFEVKEDGYSKTIGKDPMDEAAFNAALRPYYLARTKAEVAPDLPPIVYAGTPPEDNPDGLNGVWLPMDPKQGKAYEDMRRLATAHVEGGTVTANGVLAEITRLRQFACAYGVIAVDGEFYPELPSNKFEWLLEFLREREGNAGKVVMASNFTRLIEVFARELRAEGIKLLTLTGKTTDRARAELVSRFADPDDEHRLAIINTKAGGVAITLDQADDMILTDIPWTSDDEEQVVDRIHRVSRIHNVTVYRLLSEGTVDGWMAGLTDEQRTTLRAAKQDNRAMFKEATA